MNNRHRRVSKLKAQERKREWMKWELAYDEVSGLICEIYDGFIVSITKSFQAVSDAALKICKELEKK